MNQTYKITYSLNNSNNWVDIFESESALLAVYDNQSIVILDNSELTVKLLRFNDLNIEDISGNRHAITNSNYVAKGPAPSKVWYPAKDDQWPPFRWRRLSSRAIVFRGSYYKDSLFVSDSSYGDFDFEEELTISFWFYLNHINGTQIIFEHSGGFKLFTENDNLFFGSQQIMGPDSKVGLLENNKWYHMAISGTKENLQIFVNGVKSKFNISLGRVDQKFGLNIGGKANVQYIPKATWAGNGRDVYSEEEYDLSLWNKYSIDQNEDLTKVDPSLQIALVGGGTQTYLDYVTLVEDSNQTFGDLWVESSSRRVEFEDTVILASSSTNTEGLSFVVAHITRYNPDGSGEIQHKAIHAVRSLGGVNGMPY